MSNDLKVALTDQNNDVIWSAVEEDKIVYRFTVDHGVLLIYPKSISAYEMYDPPPVAAYAPGTWLEAKYV